MAQIKDDARKIKQKYQKGFFVAVLVGDHIRPTDTHYRVSAMLNRKGNAAFNHVTSNL